MKRQWKKYRNRNSTEGDCQLITAVNAYYYLTGKTVNNEDYEKYIDLVGCRHGSAISIEKVWKKLGIKSIWEGRSLLDFTTRTIGNKLPFRVESEKKKKIPLPLEFNIWHKRYGFHSTLIVDHEPRVDCFRVTNFKYGTSIEGWAFTEDLHHFEARMPTVAKGITYRLFGLKNDLKSEKIKKMWKKQQRLEKNTKGKITAKNILKEEKFTRKLKEAIQ